MRRLCYTLTGLVLILWSSASAVTLYVRIQATSDRANGPIYGVTAIQQSLKQHAATWLGRTILVRGIPASLCPLPPAVPPPDDWIAEGSCINWPGRPQSGLRDMSLGPGADRNDTRGSLPYDLYRKEPATNPLTRLLRFLGIEAQVHRTAVHWPHEGVYRVQLVKESPCWIEGLMAAVCIVAQPAT
jgi:hypothetical protein